MNLRNYQQVAIEKIRLILGKKKRKVILQLPTGSGKTILSCEIIRLAFEKGKKVLVLAPRRELIYQFVESLAKFRIYAGIVMAGERRTNSDVQVASFDTLHSRAIRNSRMAMPKADLILVDEAHLSVAKSRLEILNKYQNSTVIGLTATPTRADGKGLGEFYDSMVEGVSVGWLIDNGYLSPVRYFAPSKPDLDAVKLNKNGDYQDKALGAVMDDKVLIGDIVTNWFRLAKGKSTVVFCVDRKHARHVHQEFLQAGVESEYLDGETPTDERKDILKRVGSGSTTVLVNIFVATYGLDVPRLEVVVLARPTKSLGLYLQMVGRILRIFKNKEYATVIDHSGAVKENGFVEDKQYWTLDSKKSAKEIKRKNLNENKAFKEIDCTNCGSVFKAQKACPFCGFQAVAPSEEIPTHQAELEEVSKMLKKNNRDYSWQEKIEFFGGLKSYAMEKGYKSGWAAYKYRDKFGVWANDKRLKNAPNIEPNQEVRNYITSRNIAYANRKEVAA